MKSAFIVVLGVALCSLGGAAQAQQPDMTFFITSTPVGRGGDLGGLDGADAHCQSLAQAAGAGTKTWRAYLSTSGIATSATTAPTPINARDRIGTGPWHNAKGALIANSVDDLHGPNNKLGKETALDEKGQAIKVRGDTPVQHDILTGSDKEGRAFPANMDLTCRNWTSSTTGMAMVGHVDRGGFPPPEYASSWNAAHTSLSCTQPDLVKTGGNGLFYCFAVR